MDFKQKKNYLNVSGPFLVPASVMIWTWISTDSLKTSQNDNLSLLKYFFSIIASLDSLAMLIKTRCWEISRRNGNSLKSLIEKGETLGQSIHFGPIFGQFQKKCLNFGQVPKFCLFCNAAFSLIFFDIPGTSWSSLIFQRFNDLESIQ